MRIRFATGVGNGEGRLGNLVLRNEEDALEIDADGEGEGEGEEDKLEVEKAAAFSADQEEGVCVEF